MTQNSRCRPRLALAAAATALAGCAAPLDQPLTGYTSCNLRAADGTGSKLAGASGTPAAVRHRALT